MKSDLLNSGRISQLKDKEAVTSQLSSIDSFRISDLVHTNANISWSLGYGMVDKIRLLRRVFPARHRLYKPGNPLKPLLNAITNTSRTPHQQPKAERYYLTIPCLVPEQLLAVSTSRPPQR
jgi:hypothetical protein